MFSLDNWALILAMRFNVKKYDILRISRSQTAATRDPYQIGPTQKMEHKQRRAARFVCNTHSYYSSVTSLISTLGWADLASRRKDLRLALFYNVVFGLLAVPTEDILVHADSCTRACHGYIYSTMHTGSPFFLRTIPKWNILPPFIAEAPSIDIFKASLNPSAAPTSSCLVSPGLTISCI